MDKKRKLEEDCTPSTSKGQNTKAKGQETTGHKSSTTGDKLEATEIGKGSSVGRLELHPLYNHVILNNLFSFCQYKELANFRLVCKTWHETSLIFWRSSSILRLFRDPRDDQIYVSFLAINNQPPKANTTLLKFLDFWEAVKDGEIGLGFGEFDLCYWRFGFDMNVADRTRRRSQVERFMRLVGNHVKALILNSCIFKRLKDFEELVQSCPNLQTLNIYPSEYYISEVDQARRYQKAVQKVPLDLHNLRAPTWQHLQLKSLTVELKNYYAFQPWLELLSHFPNLTSIKVSSAIPIMQMREPRYYVSTIPSIQFLCVAIRDARLHDANSMPLKSFETEPPLETSNETESVLELMRIIKMPLQSIHIRLHLCKLQIVKDVITAHRNTLREIVAVKDASEEDFGEDHAWKRIFPCAFPFGMELQNLQELTICDRFCCSLDFLVHTPKLKHLRIFDSLDDNDLLNPLQTSLISNTTLKNEQFGKLKLLYMAYLVNIEDLHRLTTLFPNVEMLSMLLNYDQLPVVSRNWTKLLHLHVLSTEMTDEDILGMEWPDGRRIRKNPVVEEALTKYRTSERINLCYKVTAY